jgi:hypothetical protein
MSTDIVSRLQAAAESNPLFSEAADEIERLRTALHELAFRAIDTVSQTTPYRIRKKYAKDARSQLNANPPSEEARSKAKAKAKEQREKDKNDCTDRYIKQLLSKHGRIRYSNVTPELVSMKRDQLMSERISRQLNHAATHQQGVTK